MTCTSSSVSESDRLTAVAARFHRDMKSYFLEKMEPTLGESRSELELSLGNTPAAMISAEPSLAHDDDDGDDDPDDDADDERDGTYEALLSVSSPLALSRNSLREPALTESRERVSLPSVALLGVLAASDMTCVLRGRPRVRLAGCTADWGGVDALDPGVSAGAPLLALGVVAIAAVVRGEAGGASTRRGGELFSDLGVWLSLREGANDNVRRRVKNSRTPPTLAYGLLRERRKKRSEKVCFRYCSETPTPARASSDGAR